MLPLDDEHWSELTHAYGEASDIPPQLARLKADPGRADETFRQLDLWGALDHQNSVFTATFAAVPHLVDAAKRLPPEKRPPQSLPSPVACTGVPSPSVNAELHRRLPPMPGRAVETRSVPRILE